MGGMKAWSPPKSWTNPIQTGAIILYLIDRYDKEGKISCPDSIESYQCTQWLMFQVSGESFRRATPQSKAERKPGQGPYFGQLAWFARFHKPEVPSAIERYSNEMVRIFGVLDKTLEDRKWLVGDKCTIADLSFVTWSHVAKGLVKQLEMSEKMTEYPRYTAWLEAMEARPTVRKCLDNIIAGRAEHGLPP